MVYRLDPASDGTFDPDGSLYLVGNDEVGSAQTQIVIRRGRPTSDGWDWETVATSAPYLFSYTYFDHRANAVVVSPDGSTLIVNSGTSHCYSLVLSRSSRTS